MSTLFLNASPNHDGNTARLAKALLGSHPYEQLDLAGYKVYGYGQPAAEGPDDQFGEVLARVRAAGTVVVGSPVYWHNLAGQLRCFLDRCYGPVGPGSLAGRRLFFVFQGAAPEKWMLDAGEYTMSRFAALYGMEWCGMATNEREARELGRRL